MPSAFCGRRWCRLLIALVGTCIGFLFANYGTEEKRSFLKVLSSSVHTRTGPDAVLMAADPMDTSIDQNESTEGPDAVLMAADSMDTSIDQNESTEGLPAAVAEAHLDGIQPRPQRMEDATWMPWHLIFVNCVEDGRNLKRLKGREKRLTCPHSRCILTIDKNLAQKAKAMVLNPVWMAPYLVPPSIKPAGQVWVYSFHFESPKSHGFARKNTKAMSSRTDLTMTFQSKSDIFRPFYDLIPLTQDKLQKGLTNFTDAANKKYLLIWVVSNCACRSRMSLFKRLQEILGKDTVHLYGNCGKKLPCKRHDKACEAVFFQQYKFYAAFESSRCRGYITEKFFRGLQTSMVPLAYGGVGRADYERIAPKGAFLHVDDFASAEDLAKGLQEIDGDDARYSRFHEWRNKLEVSTQGSAHNRAYCELCDRIAQPIDHKKHKRSFSDLHDWMFDSCIADKPNWKTR